MDPVLLLLQEIQLLSIGKKIKIKQAEIYLPLGNSTQPVRLKPRSRKEDL